MVKEKTIEETYQKLSQREHVLKRSGVYIGDIKKNTEELWVLGDNKMVKQFVEYSPGFMKIFDEVLSNATDHAIRDPTVNKIEVNYSKETGEISVYNNGAGVPVVLHKEQNIYVPELIFGHLLSGSNYDDKDTRTTVGVNGMGIKLTNIFSKKFVVETVDSENKKKFIQEFSNNMSDKTKPKITSAANTKSYTKITFIPDYTRFSMEKLEDDTILLIKKRVYDCIANTKAHVNLYLNGEKIKGKSFTDYIKYYFDDSKIISEQNIQTIKGTEFIWEYAIVPSDHYEQISFVNGNCTYLGGKHVDYILYQIINKIKELLETKKKLKDVKPNFIKDKFCVFLKATIINPSFNSQTKETLTTQVKDFGCKVEVTESFINKIYKSSIIDEIVAFCKLKESSNLAKASDGKKVSKVYLPKLEDANDAGTAKSDQCTLILTEGDSAKTFAMWGRAIIGPEKYGVFSLKGKLLNVRDATISQLINNDEINNIKQILGLKEKKVYTDTKELRYGKIMLLTDADCVTGDTPLLLKDTNNNILSDTIERLTDNFTKDEISNKEFGNTDLQIWTEKGWTKIISIMRHKVTKTFYRVLTHTGLIDVSEDHPLLTIDGIEKTSKDCVIGDKLLHSFPIINENKINIPDNLEQFKINELWKYASKCKIPYYQSYKKLDLIKELNIIKTQPVIELNHTNTTINKNEAYVMGLFWADGSSGIYKWEYNYKPKNRPNEYCYNRITYSWAISNNNIKFLEKAKEILEKLYNLEFKIIECKTVRVNKSYKLIINGGIKTKDIVEKYTNLFYYKNDHKYKNGNKYIPKEILNSKTDVREEFLIGYYNGDGYGHDIHKETELKFDVEGKISAQCLFILCKSLNYEVSINILENKPNIISLILTKGHQQWNKHKIKKIIKLGKIENYVYDLETENHHFQGGIGQMVVHNCDGSHIKSLVVNFIHNGWPSLLKIKPNFIQTFKTPIVKAIKGKETKEFFTEQDYHLWLQGNNTKNYKINYYKGLGTSTKDDAKNLFKRFDELIVNYYHKDNKCDNSILLAFDKDKNNKVKNKDKDTDSDVSDIVHVKCTDQRKVWLANYNKDSYIDVKENVVSYQDLINKELIHFSIYDNTRSIPSICDGLKPSQRKILYYMLHTNVNVSMKVAQLTGKISSDTSYHHGEASLEGAIVGLAQDFVGTNNINLLYPDGNHGCLDPNTKILMWDGIKKLAKDIKIGDKLVGDDGNSRLILQTITGKDDMYEIKIENEKFIVNSQHKLTLVYSGHLQIFWRESDKSWRVTYFDPKNMKSVSKNIRTNLSSNKLETYNKSCLNKDDAYKQIVDFVKNLNINKYGIFDIKVCDYLKLNQTDKHHFKSVKNSKCINWVNNKTLDINSYLLGSWLGDGNSNGNGITSIDSEIIKKWVIEMNKIDCEITHDKVKETHDNYHYSVRNSGNGIKNAVGSTMECDGCEYKISEVCKWNSGIIYPIQTKKQPQKTGQHNWKKILKKNNLLDNKHIPFDYIYTSKENRLELLAGFIDTDGYVNYQNQVPRILIGQSKRLRTELIYDLKFLCETLGFNCKVYHEDKNRKTKKNEDASTLVLCITGNNLQEIPCLLTRKKIQPYTFKRNMYISNFVITSLGVGNYCGWEIDGNNRFLLGNFFITHNSRLMGGKDAASARYIKTRLSDITPLIFNKLDVGLLNLLQDDGIQIEPEWYLPIIPMVLVNGCDGIGTGYSTSIPPYNPTNLINNILRVMDDKDPLPLIPFYRNFNGEIVKDKLKENTFITKGKYIRLSDTQIKVTELPVGCWVTTYKEFLESLVVTNNKKDTKDSKTKKKFVLKNIENRTKDENDAIDFMIEFTEKSILDDLIKSNTLEKELKLTKSVNTNNMHVFNENLILTKYTDPNDLLLDWYDLRLEYYQKRKDFLIKKFTDELIILKAKIRFVSEYIEKIIDINKKSKEFITNLLVQRKYPNQEGSYDYLLNLPVYAFTLERIESLNKQVQNKQAELDYIKSKTDKELWKVDLEELNKLL